jgi:hypothetical protein
MKTPPVKPVTLRTSAPDLDLIARTLALLMEQLGKEIAARGGVLPTGMLDDLQAISLEGVDPMWQLERLQEIMDRWLRAN